MGKNKDLDSWLTKIRAPYERVFSKQNKRRNREKSIFSIYGSDMPKYEEINCFITTEFGAILG